MRSRIASRVAWPVYALTLLFCLAGSLLGAQERRESRGAYNRLDFSELLSTVQPEHVSMWLREPEAEKKLEAKS
ncbi:hypothetical protein BH18ACT11_BH18ACT11_18280 [soil metagenome]